MFLVAAIHSDAQEGQGSIQGVVIDSTTSKPMPFVSVVILSGKHIVNGATTDFNGHYKVKGLSPGTYRMRVLYNGYNTIEVVDVFVSEGKETIQDFIISYNPSLELEDVKVSCPDMIPPKP